LKKLDDEPAVILSTELPLGIGERGQLTDVLSAAKLTPVPYFALDGGAASDQRRRHGTSRFPEI
jgi:hypothetical protein